MTTLQKLLASAFKAPVKRQPDPYRKSRALAKQLAALYGIEIEKFKPADGCGMNVWPPKGLKHDPYKGDHYAQDWDDALECIKAYISLINK